MRKKLGKEINETKQIVDYESWEGTVSPYLKNVFALHCLVQQNCQSEENVGKGPGYFFDPIGFPNYARYSAYLTTINSQCSITQTDIDNQCNTLEEMHGTEIGAFVCGKYLIHSLLYYLKSKCPKRNLDIDSLREYLISNFDISLLDYIKERIEEYRPRQQMKRQRSGYKRECKQKCRGFLQCVFHLFSSLLENKKTPPTGHTYPIEYAFVNVFTCEKSAISCAVQVYHDSAYLSTLSHKFQHILSICHVIILLNTVTAVLSIFSYFFTIAEIVMQVVFFLTVHKDSAALS